MRLIKHNAGVLTVATITLTIIFGVWCAITLIVGSQSPYEALTGFVQEMAVLFTTAITLTVVLAMGLRNVREAWRAKWLPSFAASLAALACGVAIVVPGFGAEYEAFFGLALACFVAVLMQFLALISNHFEV